MSKKYDYEFGEICESKIPSRAVSFEWKILDIITVLKKQSFLYSPEINFMGSIFFLELYTNKPGDDLSFFLDHKSKGNEDEGRMVFAIGIKKANGSKQDVADGILGKYGIRTEDYGSLRVSDLVKRKSELAPLDILTVTCTIWSDGLPSVNASRETQTDLPTNDSGEKERTHHEDEGTALLRKHFQDLLLKGQDRDVILKVKDKVFRAHKDVLRARSPVFAAMFAHQMTEAESGEVAIEDCDPDAFGQLLEYVYTGRVDNLTLRNTLGLYYAADKYDFSSLKKTCVDYLKTSLSTNGVCDVIAMAVKYNEEGLRDCAMAFFTNHFHGILMTIEWQHFLKRDSSLANELIIKAMKSYYKKDE